MPKALDEWQIEDATRLKQLFETIKPMNQTDFGAEYGIGSQAMVWQYLNGKRPLNVRAATAFAKGLGITIDDFSDTIAREITEAYRYLKAAGSSNNSWPFDSISPDEYRKLDQDDRRDVEMILGSKAQKVRKTPRKSAA